ncbi:MAG: 30S ribosomal protein S16 [Hymenobacteraceae bacterium]|nr:30S ribosomal protein S16 [Hymenobacteraceae bacterium]
MAVKIRLARRGRKKLAMYDIVVADSRSPRDGRFIEKLGTYNPNTVPASINYDADKAFDWVMKGAQPTDSVRAMLSYRGVLYRKHLQLGVNKGAITQDVADNRYHDWIDAKDAKIAAKTDANTAQKDEARKTALAAETKVKEARAETLRQKQAAADAARAAAEAAANPAPVAAPVAAAAPVVEAAEAEAPAAEAAE